MVSDETNAAGEELTPGTDQDLAPEETPKPEAEQPEPQEPAAKELTAEELKQQLADRGAKIAGLEANYKAMQRNLEAERRRAGTLDPETRKIIEDMQENQALLLDEIDGIKAGREDFQLEPEAKPAGKKSRLETLREEKAAKATVQQEAENAKEQMRQMLAISGVDPATAAQATDAARIAFEQGEYKKAVSLFGHGLSQVKRAPATPPVSEKDIDERAGLKALQMMKERGLLDMELGGSSAASSGSMEEIEEKFMHGDISASEYEAALKKHNGG